LAPAAAGPARGAAAEAWEIHPVRKISLYFCLATLFLRLSVLPELILYTAHVNTYLLYLTAPPAILSALLMGSVGRTFRARAAYYWLAFFGCMLLATAFSSWPGGSAFRTITYARVDGIFLILVGGLAMNWREVRTSFRVIAAAAVVNMASARIFAHSSNGRLSMEASGSLGNSNDLASQLLMVLPFLLFFMLGRGRSKFPRIAIVPMLLYGLWIILGAASRGALVGLAVMFLYVLWHISLPQKVALTVTCGALVLVAMTTLPATTRNRLGTIFGGKDIEAIDSAESRRYLFRTSVQFTIEHPVFGVGPDQFPIVEGKQSRAQGFHGNWHQTHNAYTQVSSECGVPAAFFFIAGLGSAGLLVLRTYRVAKRDGYVEIASGCFCYLLGAMGYLVSLIFLAQAYSFKLPALVGLGITLSYAAARTMQADRERQAAIPAPRTAMRR